MDFCVTIFFPSLFTSYSASNSRVSEISEIILTFCTMSETQWEAVENVAFFSKLDVIIKLPVIHDFSFLQDQLTYLH